MAWIYKPTYKRRNNDKRKERTEVYSSTLWKKMRLAQLRLFPVCQICQLEGKSTLAIDVHHLVSFLESENKFERDKRAFDSNNLLSTCKEHHSSLHNGELKGCKSLEDIKKRIEDKLKK